MTQHEFDRVPVIVKFEDRSSFTETYGFAGSQGYVFLEGQMMIPRGVPSKTLFVFMHPATTLNLMPAPAGLAKAGCHVLCAASRYPKNDTALIMEKVVVDLGAYMRYARQELGYENIILVGWSGGGSLAMFYQSQAVNPTITHTPAGDPVDLTNEELIPADQVIFIAAHIGRAHTLSQWIDPSVIDELDPDTRDAELDLYNPDNPNQPPYDAAFLERFRAAQLARVRRITQTAKSNLARLKERGGAEMERGFIVHRTMADPRFLDPAVDPNGRPPGTCYLGNPETVNVGPVGLARFSTLRSWLSQWSIDDSNADAVKCVAQFDTRLLLIENGADDATPPSDTRQVFAAARSPDKTMEVIEGASHYYRDQPDKLAEMVSLCLDWTHM